MDVFSWTYVGIPELNLQIVMPQLNIKERTGPMKHAARNFRLKLKVQFKQEIQKLQDASFIKLIQHPI